MRANRLKVRRHYFIRKNTQDIPPSTKPTGRRAAEILESQTKRDMERSSAEMQIARSRTRWGGFVLAISCKVAEDVICFS